MSITIQLPDGSSLDYEDSVSPGKVAEDISPRLAGAALVAKLDGRLCDLTGELSGGKHELKILTAGDEEALEVLRHTAAHVLAQAVVRLYGKAVQYTIGPALVDDFQYGFYYDFDLPRPIAQEDLAEIQAEMKRIVAENIPIERIDLPVEQAKDQMDSLGQAYKVEMIDDLARDSGTESVSFYRQGDFLDMCRGPHLPHTGKVGKAFKLLTTAGAYWRGDENNKMLTRIYGIAFFDKKDLAAHLERFEQARKRDHRVIGRRLGLFIISDKVGAVLPL